MQPNRHGNFIDSFGNRDFEGLFFFGRKGWMLVSRSRPSFLSGPRTMAVPRPSPAWGM